MCYSQNQLPEVRYLTLRWKPTLACILVVLLIGFGISKCLPTPVDKGFKDAHDSLFSAKSREEIEAFIGPPGDYATRRRVYWGIHTGLAPEGSLVEWRDDFALIEVYFFEGTPIYRRILLVEEYSPVFGHKLGSKTKAPNTNAN